MRTGVRMMSEVSSFDSPAWPALQQHLDTIPAFTVVNENAEPLGYEQEGKSICIFFADVERAQQELEMSRQRFPNLELSLLAAGLGDVYKRTVRGDALLVPSAEALSAAGDDWDSETLPLYTCLLMSQPAADGSGEMRTPFFLDPRDAQRSLDAAIAAATSGQEAPLSEYQKAQLQLACTSLPAAVEMVLSGRELEVSGKQWQLVPSAAAVAYIQQQQAGGGAQAPVAAAQAIRAEALAEQKQQERQERKGAEAGPGLFPT